MNVWTDDASSLADAVRQREVRAADAIEASLEAIQWSKLNTVVTLDAEGARRQAETIDERLERGEGPGLWAGVPLLVKEMDDAAGMPTSYGSLVFKNNTAERDSTHGERLRAAGAVIVVNRELGIRRSALKSAQELATRLLQSRVQTIIFAPSRLTVELLVHALRRSLPSKPGEPPLVEGYRGGYLPRERRAIEAGLRQGEVRAVAATNALELGHD